MEKVAVQVAGNRTVHYGRVLGTYESGTIKYGKLCASSGRDRHFPYPVDAPVTCKRCLAKGGGS